ncbi:ABC transporter substrate-binding protein [Patescibacteria group bacterium]|nr:ABC transporter substrate-binding protein [Patescibacteria group bacterium]
MTKNAKIIVGAIIAVVIIGGIWYGAGRKPAPVETEKEPIKIGAILPFTGKLGYYGDYYSHGLNLAIEEINNAGGINGKKIEIIYEDNQGDTSQSITAYQKLSQTDGVKIYITTLSGATLALAPLVENNHDILFNLNSAAPTISKAGDYTFRNNIFPLSEIKALSTFINQKDYNKIALLMFNNDAGVEYKDLFSEEYISNGGEIVGSELYEQGATDFRTQLTKIKAKNVDAIIMFAYANEGGLIIKQAKEIGVTAPFFSFYTSEDSKLIEVGGSATEGLIYTHCFNESAAASFKEILQKKHGTTAGLFYSAIAYDTLKILAKTLNNCDEKDTVCVKADLYNVKEYPGTSGITTINADGDTEKSVFLKTIKNGQFVPLEN